MNEKYTQQTDEYLKAKLLGVLDEREYFMLHSKYTLNKTDEEITKELNLSLQHFRNILEKAERKLEVMKNIINNTEINNNFKEENLDLLISDLDLSERAQKVLKSLKVLTLDDLRKISEKEILSVRGSNKKILDEIEQMLSVYNLMLKKQ